MSIDSNIIKAAQGKLVAFVQYKDSAPMTIDVNLFVSNHADEIEHIVHAGFSFRHQGKDGYVFFAPRSADPAPYSKATLAKLEEVKKERRIQELERELAELRAQG